MNFIPCSSDCFYQHDGYCRLNKSATVTNLKNIGCPHFINRPGGMNLPGVGFNDPPTFINTNFR